MLSPRLAPLLLVATVLLPPEGAAAVRQALPHRVTIDWTQGRLLATGAGAPDLDSPGPDVARIAARRAAERAATTVLAEAARSLAGAHIDRLEAVVAHARTVQVEYSSDGAVEVTRAIPLEALRDVDPAVLPRAVEGAPTAIVVDARRQRPVPALGVALASGATRYAGPTVWHARPEEASADDRLGARPTAAEATSADGNTLTVDLDPAVLDRARNAGALVVIVAGETPLPPPGR